MFLAAELILPDLRLHREKGFIGNIPTKRVAMSIEGDLDDSATVSVTFAGVGDGVLTATDVAVIPLDDRIDGGTKGAVCASFRGVNLLEMYHRETRSLAHEACVGINFGQ